MTHVCCPQCGQKLLHGVDGNKVSTKCPKCKTEVTVSFNGEEMHFVFKTFDGRLHKKTSTR